MTDTVFMMRGAEYLSLIATDIIVSPYAAARVASEHHQLPLLHPSVSYLSVGKSNDDVMR